MPALPLQLGPVGTQPVHLYTRIAFMFTALAVAVTVASWLVLGRSEPQRPASAVSAPIATEAKRSAELEPGVARELLDGAHVTTSEAPEKLRVGDSELTLARASELRVSGNERAGWFLALEQGKLECNVRPRATRPPFIVIAGETRVSVIGTRFSVTQGERGTQVAVDEGKVLVDYRGQMTELVPGETWSEEAAPVKPPASAAAVADAPAKKRVSRAMARVEKRFEHAARLESTKPRAALRIYRSLRRARGPWQADALYAEARFEHQLGHHKRAKPLLKQYLKRYPDGEKAADARALLERVKAKRGGV
ncbi:MAG: FecR domain-containing protein [Polyangiaceae bacterium]